MDKYTIDIWPLSDRVAEWCKRGDFPPRTTAAAIEIATKMVAAGYDEDWSWPGMAGACIDHATTLAGEDEPIEDYRSNTSLVEIIERVVKGEIEYPEDPTRYVTPDTFALIDDEDREMMLPAEHCAVYCLYLRLSTLLWRRILSWSLRCTLVVGRKVIRNPQLLQPVSLRPVTTRRME